MRKIVIAATLALSFALPAAAQDCPDCEKYLDKVPIQNTTQRVSQQKLEKSLKTWLKRAESKHEEFNASSSADIFGIDLGVSADASRIKKWKERLDKGVVQILDFDDYQFLLQKTPDAHALDVWLKCIEICHQRVTGLIVTAQVEDGQVTIDVVYRKPVPEAPEVATVVSARAFKKGQSADQATNLVFRSDKIDMMGMTSDPISQGKEPITIVINTDRGDVPKRIPGLPPPARREAPEVPVKKTPKPTPAATATSWKFTVTTGTREYAGTNADPYLEFSWSDKGRTRTKTVWMPEQRIDENEAGQTTVYKFKCEVPLEHLQSVRLGHNDEGDHSGWFVEEAELEVVKVKEEKMALPPPVVNGRVQIWLSAKRSDGGKLERSLPLSASFKKYQRD